MFSTDVNKTDEAENEKYSYILFQALFKTQISSKEKVFEKGKSVLCIAETNNLNGAREPES